MHIWQDFLLNLRAILHFIHHLYKFTLSYSLSESVVFAMITQDCLHKAGFASAALGGGYGNRRKPPKSPKRPEALPLCKRLCKKESGPPSITVDSAKRNIRGHNFLVPCIRGFLYANLGYKEFFGVCFLISEEMTRKKI